MYLKEKKIKAQPNILKQINEEVLQSIVSKSLIIDKINFEIPIDIIPFVLSKPQLDNIKYVSERIATLLKKSLIKITKHDTLFQDYWFGDSRFNDWYKKIIDRQLNQQINLNELFFLRIDYVFDEDENLKIIDFSTDISDYFWLSGFFENIFQNSSTFNSMFSEDNSLLFETSIFDKFLQRFFNCLKKYDLFKSDMSIGLLNSNGNNDYIYTILNELYSFFGYKVKLTDFNTFFNESSSEQYNNFDIFFRLVPPLSIYQSTQDNSNLMNSLLNDDLLLLNPLSQYLFDSNGILAFLTDSYIHRSVSKNDIEFIQNHLTWTKLLNKRYIRDEDNIERDSHEFLENNQNDLILKRSSAVVGNQIIFGSEVEPAKWKMAIPKVLSDGKWVCQKQIKLKNINSDENDVLYDDRPYHIINSYVVGGKYIGSSVRTSDNIRIQGIEDSYFVPLMIEKE